MSATLIAPVQWYHQLKLQFDSHVNYRWNFQFGFHQRFCNREHSLEEHDFEMFLVLRRLGFLDRELARRESSCRWCWRRKISTKKNSSQPTQNSTLFEFLYLASSIHAEETIVNIRVFIATRCAIRKSPSSWFHAGLSFAKYFARIFSCEKKTHKFSLKFSFS